MSFALCALPTNDNGEATMKTILGSCSILGITFCVVFAMFALAPLQTATAKTVHVDASAAPGGNGNSKKPFQTIEEGIASLPRNGGTVLIQPGTYIGPIVVDRSNVIIRGDTTPIKEGGFLTGFDEEVVVTIVEPLSDPGVFEG